MALALLALGILLCLLGVGLLGQWQESAAHHQGTSANVLLAGAVSVAGLGLLLWWTISVLVAGAAVLLEHSGKNSSAAAARRLSPVFMQRAVVATLSLQLVTGVAAQAVPFPPGPDWAPTQAQSSTPRNPAAIQEVRGHGGNGVHQTNAVQPVFAPEWTPSAHADAPEPARPAGNHQLPSPIDPGWQPAPPLVEPGLMAAPLTRTTSDTGDTGAGGRPGEVAVLAGDTLWDIVANYLGPEASDVDIALEWPRWYAANRGLIGGSPDLLLPGQVLQAPTAP